MVFLKLSGFRDITLDVNQRFGGTYCPHTQLAICFYAHFLQGLLFGTEDGGHMFLQNCSLLLTDYMAYLRRENSS
jgi:hypothetical protein